MIDVEVFSKAGVGKHNEDYVLHTEIAPGMSLIVVCDGMGGLSYGENASKIIAHSIENHLRQNFCSHTPAQTIINALHYANDELAKECVRLKAKMGASVALTLFAGNACYYTWLGDARIYLANGGKTELLTKDHLAIEDNHTFLSRCINGKDFRYPLDVGEVVISSGDEIFIATDGYYLYSELGSMTESVITTDDATIARIKLK